jgi:predicted NBD/HSP70 family sugar kinase
LRQRHEGAKIEQYVGLDVSLKETSVCVIDQTGKIIWQGRCTSTPEAIRRTVQAGLQGQFASGWRLDR